MATSDKPMDPDLLEKKNELSAIALEEFNNKNYTSCLDTLNKLEITCGRNPKVVHNRAIAEFHARNFCNYDKLQNALYEAIGVPGMAALSDNISPDMSVPHFNLAVILYHLNQPFTALKVLTKIIKNIEKLDDSVVQRVGLLTLTLLLDTNQTKEGAAFLELLLKRLSINLDSLIVDEDDGTDESVDRAKGKSEKLGDFRNMLRLGLIRTYLLNRKNVIIPSDESSTYSVLKGHQYYLGHDYQMAAKDLSKKFTNEPFSVNKHGENQNTCIANNMGLIHFNVRHYAIAVRFFQHALAFDQASMLEATQDSNSVPLYENGASKRSEVLYNLGAALLHHERPGEAFECLLVPLNVYHNNPRLWLRLAECCIMVHQQTLKQEDSKHIVTSTVCADSMRKLALKAEPPKYVSDEGQSFAIPSPNLEFGNLCLRNALSLVEKMNKQFETSDSDSLPCNPSPPVDRGTVEKLRCGILTAYSYVLLCLGEYHLANEYGIQLLQMTDILDTHRMLGNLYCAEALIMLNRLPEALLHLEPSLLKGMRNEDFETRFSPDWKVNNLDAAEALFNYNLAATLAIQGKLDAARNTLNSCNHSVVLNHVKMLKLYLELRAGNYEKCRIMIRLDSPQYS